MSLKRSRRIRQVPWLLLLAWLTFVPSIHAFYDPGTQRWLNRDPVGEADGPNLYAFVHNNPVSMVDPDGLTGWLIFLEPPPVIPRPVGIPLPRIPGVSYPRSGPFPPEGTVESPFRPGSFGRWVPDPKCPGRTKFEEVWRYDKGDPSKPGWGGRDHFHYWGGDEHMTPPLPPFKWFTVPPMNAPPAQIIAPPGVKPPSGLIPITPPKPPKRLPPGTVLA